MIESDQSKFIREARAFLKPSEVERGQVPGWFDRGVRKAFGLYADRTLFSGVFKNERVDWLDHYGSTDFRGKLAFVAEPYEPSPKAIQQAHLIAEAIGANLGITATSYHFPGRTVRLTFNQRQ